MDNFLQHTEAYDPLKYYGMQCLKGIAGLGLLILVHVAITQYIAHHFSYNPSLGMPWKGWLYPPWLGMYWAVKWKHVDPTFFQRIWVAFCVSHGLLVVVGGLLKPANNPKEKGIETLHGSARFATKKEIHKMGILEKEPHSMEGVIIGGFKKGNKVLAIKHNGPEHVLVFAPTRSGKGVSLVLPTLLSWNHSAVVLDLKGENYRKTSGWRFHYAGNRILHFKPDNKQSAKYNPLAEVTVGGDYEVADVQNIATLIADPKGKGLEDNHWAQAARGLLVAVILYCLHEKKKVGQTASLKDVIDFFGSKDYTFTELLKEKMLKSSHDVIATTARNMLNKSDNERKSVVSSAVTFLDLYNDPIVATNTSSSDFRIDDLMKGEKPCTLYIDVPPSEKERLKPLIRLLISQIIRQRTRKENDFDHRLLLMLDEFPSLGKLEIVEESLAFMASYGLKAYLITQDLSQLYSAYSQNESIVGNCHIRIAFAPNKVETARLLSEMTGTMTILKHYQSKSGKRKSLFKENVSEGIHETKRPLLTVDECMRMPGTVMDEKEPNKIKEPGDMLIFMAGEYPIYGKQFLFFKDKWLARRANIHPITTNKTID